MWWIGFGASLDFSSYFHWNFASWLHLIFFFYHFLNALSRAIHHMLKSFLLPPLYVLNYIFLIDTCGSIINPSNFTYLGDASLLRPCYSSSQRNDFVHLINTFCHIYSFWFCWSSYSKLLILFLQNLCQNLPFFHLSRNLDCFRGAQRSFWCIISMRERHCT